MARAQAREEAQPPPPPQPAPRLSGGRWMSVCSAAAVDFHNAILIGCLDYFFHSNEHYLPSYISKLCEHIIYLSTHYPVTQSDCQCTATMNANVAAADRPTYRRRRRPLS